jgi:hypothetical protein
MGWETVADRSFLATSYREDADLDGHLAVEALILDHAFFDIPTHKVAGKEIILQADIVYQAVDVAPRRDALCAHKGSKRGNIGLLQFTPDDKSSDACSQNTANLESFTHRNFLFPRRVNVL